MRADDDIKMEIITYSMATLSWHRIRFNGRLLWTRQWASELQVEEREFPWPTQELSAAQEGPHTLS